MRQVFVSHNVTADGEIAATLRDTLLQQELADRVFLSSSGDRPEDGASWRSWIANTISNVDLVVFVASESSLSPWCSAEVGIARSLEKPVLPLLTVPGAPINPVIADLQFGLVGQPLAELTRSINRLLGPAQDLPAIDPDSSPYPGLDPLDERQARLLFGRSEQTRAVIASIRNSRLAGPVILSGPSGSGKSSLLRAGVLPPLRRDEWSINGPLQPR